MTSAIDTRMKCTETWCDDHLIDDGLVTHASHDVQVPMTAGGRSEQMVAVVAIERDDLEDHVGKPHVRLELTTGRGIPRGAPMTADQARQLAAALQRAADFADGGAR
jgi:hypothetical protein